jgi:hypothetical protein
VVLARATLLGMLVVCGGATVVSADASGVTVTPRRSVSGTDAPPRAVPPGADVTAAPAVAVDALKRYRSVRAHATVARPARISVPSIGVASRLLRLGRNLDGTIEVPGDWERAGWYRRGPRPGQAGPAVILGHVDSTSGPAVFFRLGELAGGDEIRIDRTDGSIVTFVVERVERHAKTRFPTDDVYLPTLQPTLRLVTCGGVFDAVSGHYVDNVVVFAALAM